MSLGVESMVLVVLFVCLMVCYMTKQLTANSKCSRCRLEEKYAKPYPILPTAMEPSIWHGVEPVVPHDSTEEVPNA